MSKRLTLLIAIALVVATLPLTNTHPVAAGTCGVLEENTNYNSRSVDAGPFSVNAGDTIVVSWVDANSAGSNVNTYQIYASGTNEEEGMFAEANNAPAVGSVSYTFSADYDAVYVWLRSNTSSRALASYRIEIVCGSSTSSNDGTTSLPPIPGPDMVEIPNQAVVGAVLTTTYAYFAPNANAITEIEIEAGKTLWVYGLDASGQYYKIMFSGKYFWLPVGVMGPNVQSPWNGWPLPTDIVE